MTEREMQQLSREVAEKVGILPTKTEYLIGNLGTFHNEVWLHEDNARCFELMVKYRIFILNYDKNVSAHTVKTCHTEHYSDHNNDAELATRIAILKAVKEVA